MKILHINEHLAWCGGVETYLLSLIPELERRDHEQVVVFGQGDPRLVPRAHQLVEVSRFGRSAEQSGYRRMSEILQAEAPDLVHLHQTYNIGIVQAAFDHAPTLLTGHDYRYLCPASTFYYRRTAGICDRVCGLGCFAATLRQRCLTVRPLSAFHYYRRVRWFAARAARFQLVLAPSEFARLRFLQAGFRPDKVVVHPYFCPIDPLTSPRPMPVRPTILFLGRIRPNKGYQCFLEALGLLPKTIRGLLVGDASDERRRELQTCAVRANCADRLEIRNWVDRETVANVYHEASVFVFPSVWAETLGIVGLEALACGVPVVASDAGGVREWLKDGLTGVLVPPKSPEAIAAAVTKILGDNSRCGEMGSNGIALIQEKFSRRQHIEATLSLYASCIPGRGTA